MGMPSPPTRKVGLELSERCQLTTGWIRQERARMDNHVVTADGAQAVPPPPGRERDDGWLPPGWRRFARIALVCYVVVAVFGVVYGIVRLISPDTPASAAVIWGLCAAGPLAVAFVWDRLTGFKVLGVEFTLADSFARIDATLATALSASENQYFSGNEAIFQVVDRVIANPSIELLELNLRTTQYWWSTRVYLQAALVADYTNIQRLVFVDGDAQRHYVGMASPGEVRRALGQLPGLNLELAYRQIQQEVRQAQQPSELSEVARIVYSWSASAFTQDGQAVSEDAAKTSMSAELLTQRVKLETTTVEWTEPLDSPRLQALVLDKGFRFVPLTENGRLARVVNTENFARRIASQAVRASLR